MVSISASLPWQGLVAACAEGWEARLKAEDIAGSVGARDGDVLVVLDGGSPWVVAVLLAPEWEILADFDVGLRVVIGDFVVTADARAMLDGPGVIGESGWSDRCTVTLR